MTRATQWSMEKQNNKGVAVTVRMETQQLVSNIKLKDFLGAGFKHYSTENVNFFFEQNDTVGTGITFHVRGGTDGLYTLGKGDQIKEAVAGNSRIAKNEL